MVPPRLANLDHLGTDIAFQPFFSVVNAGAPVFRASARQARSPRDIPTEKLPEVVPVAEATKVSDDAAVWVSLADWLKA